MVPPRWLPFALIVLLPLSAASLARGQDDPMIGEPAPLPRLQPSGLLRGHTKMIYDVAFSPDGKQIASAGEDAPILWDASTGKILFRLVPPGSSEPLGAFRVAFSPDGRTLAVAGWGGWVYLFETATGKPGEVLKDAHVPVFDLAYSPDGLILAAGSSLLNKQEVALFDTRTNRLLGSLKPIGKGSTAFAFTPDGKTLVVVDQQELTAWDVASRNLVKSLALGVPNRNHFTVSPTLACAPKTPIIAATGGVFGEERTAFYDARTLQIKGTLPLPEFERNIHALCFSPNGLTLASAGPGNATEGPITFWDVTTARPVGQLVGLKDANQAHLAFSPDGRRFIAAVTTTENFAISLWNLPGGSGVGKSKTKATSKKKR